MRNSKENSRHIEVMHEMLVSELKDELCRVMCNSQEEECLEVDDTHKK